MATDTLEPGKIKHRSGMLSLAFLLQQVLNHSPRRSGHDIKKRNTRQVTDYNRAREGQLFVLRQQLTGRREPSKA